MTTLDVQGFAQNTNLFPETPISLNDTLKSDVPQENNVQALINQIALEDNEYEVETIVEKRKEKKRVFYLVKWKNFSMDYATWEPTENLRNAQTKVRQFERLLRVSSNKTQIAANFQKLQLRRRIPKAR